MMSIALKAEFDQKQRELERRVHELGEKTCLAREHLHRIEIAAAEARGALQQLRALSALVRAEPEIKS